MVSHINLPIRVRPEKDHAMAAKKKKKGHKENIQEKWDQYFGTDDNDLARWQQLGRDLGIPEEKLISKTQTRKVSACASREEHVCLRAHRLTRPDLTFGHIRRSGGSGSTFTTSCTMRRISQRMSDSSRARGSCPSTLYGRERSFLERTSPRAVLCVTCLLTSCTRGAARIRRGRGGGASV